MHAVVDNGSPLLLDLHKTKVIYQYPAFSLVRVSVRPDPDEILPIDVDSDRVFVNGRPMNVPDGEFVRDGAPRCILRFFGPVAPAWKASLTAAGALIHFHCPPFGLCAELPSGLATSALRKALPALAGLQPYEYRFCTRALADQSPGAAAHAGMPRSWVDLVCFGMDDRERIELQLGEAGMEVLSLSRYKVRLRDCPDLEGLRRMKGVKLADRARAPLLAGSALHEAVGLGATAALPESPEVDGAGQVLAVADTGLDRGATGDALHPDFRGRIRAITSWPVNPSWDAFVVQAGADGGPADRNSGHGTHVAGLALGDGTRSRGKYRGLAPAAELVFQAIEQYTEVKREHRAEMPSGYYLNGRPLDLQELFQQARDLGARIHVNAWGDPAEGQYTDDSYEADLFLWKHPDAVVLFAAGNEGSDRDGDRVLDRSSLYAPASAKNVVSVGATEGPRAGVGLRGGWSAFDPDGRRFAARDLRGDAISGEPDRIALFSSTGPTRDGRIKPDICAPGTNLAAPRTQASATRGWGLASPLPYYMYLGGTSMATGVAGGCVALLRQAWSLVLGSPPSGPALKALLIYGAKPLPARNGDAREAAHVAGFGRIDLAPSLATVNRRPAIEDRAGQGLETGDVFELPVSLSGDRPFTAVLTWYDYPGEVLVNDLDLCLIDGSGNRIWGNHPVGGSGQPDRRNSVERIALEAPVSGDYRLLVTGVNIPAGPQGFALVHNGVQGRATPLTQPRFNLPVTWIKGIGPVYGRRLAAAGIETVAQLLPLTRERLGDLLRSRGATMQRLWLRIDRLRSPPGNAPASLPPALLLSDVFRQDPPAGMEKNAWIDLRQSLVQIGDVFDREVHERIQVRELFITGNPPD